MNDKGIAIPKLPDKLKRLRRSIGWSQAQLGKKLGVNVQLISKYERGVLCPPTPMMVKIAAVTLALTTCSAMKTMSL